MNRVLGSLEEKGYIRRARSEADRRMVFIRLTGEGEEAYRIAHADVDALLARLLERIGEEHALALAGEINEVVAVLDEILGHSR